jgi:hypothetical protein
MSSRAVDAWPSLMHTLLAPESRRGRAARVCASFAQLALAGPGAWRATVRQTLLEVGRALVDALDERSPAAPAAAAPFEVREVDATFEAARSARDEVEGELDDDDAEVDADEAIPSASEPALRAEHAWAAWI